MAVLDSLFRKVYLEDLQIDQLGQGNTSQVRDNAGNVVTVKHINASHLVITSGLANYLGLLTGSNIEDAVLALNERIDNINISPEYTDAGLNLDPSTPIYLDNATLVNQMDVNKYLYDLINTINPVTPSYTDLDIATSNDTKSVLGSNITDVSAALIYLDNKIDSIDSDVNDLTVSITQQTKDQITDFTGNNQSDMNIFLNNKIEDIKVVTLWENATPNSIKPKDDKKVLSSIYYFTDANSNISLKYLSTSNSDEVKFGVNTNNYISSLSSVGGNYSYVNTSLDFGLKISHLTNSDDERKVELGYTDYKLYIDYNANNDTSDVNLTYSNQLGLFMKKEYDGDESISLLSRNVGLELNYNNANNYSTVNLYTDTNTYLKIGAYYRVADLKLSEHQFLEQHGPSAGDYAFTKLSFSENTYLRFNEEGFGVQTDVDVNGSIKNVGIFIFELEGCGTYNSTTKISTETLFLDNLLNVDEDTIPSISGVVYQENGFLRIVQ